MSRTNTGFRLDRILKAGPARGTDDSPSVLKKSATNELFVGVVAPAGAGAGTAAGVIAHFLAEQTVGGATYEVETIKASAVIREWASRQHVEAPPEHSGAGKMLAHMTGMQDLGDRMREAAKDNSAVAIGLVAAIRRKRAELSGLPEGEIDHRPRAYVLDSLRHPAEVQLLRRLYGDSFVLVGVVCDPDVRRRRLEKLHYGFGPRDETALNAFMTRDADAEARNGQHVTDTFHEADFFVDNSIDAQSRETMTTMNGPIRRFVDIFVGSDALQRPTMAETAMHHAHSAQLRSACLSRQVGAALVDENGNVVATGTNEVPMAGGGVYGERFGDDTSSDQRCAFRPERYCSSNREQNDIIDELIRDFPALLEGRTKPEVVAALRRTRVGGLIEFSRAVHAEMDAILSAARAGVSPRAKRLFVTTFPCHYCARHIVAAGIDEVQYIEPYPKSRATTLHRDAITTDSRRWVAPSCGPTQSPAAPSVDQAGQDIEDGRGKVLFRPFVGVSPRMYERAFMKDRSLKDRTTGDYKVGQREWGRMSDLFEISYVELEAQLQDSARGKAV